MDSRRFAPLGFVTPLARVAVATLALSVAGCSDGTEVPVDRIPGGAVQILVAPWEVDSRADSACFSIAVHDASGAPVWADDDICTDRFGVGPNGTLSYVGLCDASGSGVNHIAISLTRLTADDGSELGHWGTRAPSYVGSFVCRADADALVRASFLVLTPGEGGFLDVQVSLQEVECNAKVDCQSDLLVPTTSQDDDECNCGRHDNWCRLHGAQNDIASATGTIVVALACDAHGTAFTPLMLDEVVMTCTAADQRPVTVIVDPALGTGALPGFPDAFVFGAIGNAGVSDDGTSFWTLAIGIEAGWSDCHLWTRMTASDGRSLRDNDQFPIIVASDIAFTFDSEGTFACTPNPLDGDGSGLSTAWGAGAELDFRGCLAADGNIRACP